MQDFFLFDSEEERKLKVTQVKLLYCMFYYVCFMGTCVLHSRNAEHLPAMTLQKLYSHHFLTPLTSAQLYNLARPYL